ncbi:TPA: hypothetical protein ACT5CR_007159, partial [Burkholderia cenocepacia]
MKQPRDEAKILEDLTALAGSLGYVHAIAHICHRDNVIHINGKLKSADMERLFSRERLNRAELTTLIGLMAKKPFDLTPQSYEVIENYVKRTDSLMQELHDAMSYPTFAAMFEAMQAGTQPPDPWRGPGMREPIFYGTESAYAFQYRDFVPEKYAADDEWMLKVKGFTSGHARTIAKSMCALMDEKGTRLFIGARTADVPPGTWLTAFEFSLDEVALHSGVAKNVVEAFFRAFLFEGDNSGFKEVGDFNEVAARPLLAT